MDGLTSEVLILSRVWRINIVFYQKWIRLTSDHIWPLFVDSTPLLRLCILVQTIHTIKILLFTIKTVQCLKMHVMISHKEMPIFGKSLT